MPSCHVEELIIAEIKCVNGSEHFLKVGCNLHLSPALDLEHCPQCLFLLLCKGVQIDHEELLELRLDVAWGKVVYCLHLSEQICHELLQAEELVDVGTADFGLDSLDVLGHLRDEELRSAVFCLLEVFDEDVESSFGCFLFNVSQFFIFLDW